MHNASHLTAFNRFRKNIKNVPLKHQKIFDEKLFKGKLLNLNINVVI